MSASGLPVAPEALLRRLEWRIIRRLDGRLQGDFRTLLHGSGIDVAELREYEPGDDVRHLDWNVTARMDTPYVRTFLEDRDVAAWLLLDRSASMSFGPAHRPKESVQVDLAATLARVLGRSGNPVGALLWNNGLERRIEPRSGRNQTLMIARHLLAVPEVPKVGTRTDLRGLFELAERTIRRRSLIIVMSDFLAEPGWEKPLSLLNRRHEVVAIRLADPRESVLPDAGIIVVEDAETGELLTVDTSDPAFRARLGALAGERDQAVKAAAQTAQVELHEVSTEDDLIGFLVRVANRRKQRRR
jgi:uncharacterized protein (DUF58 family)